MSTPAHVLHGSALQTAAAIHYKSDHTMAEELRGSDRKRFLQLLALSTTERLNLAHCLSTLFGAQDANSLNGMRSLRSEINKAARTVGCDLSFVVDTQIKLPPAQRQCWFTSSKSSRTASAERLARESTAPDPHEPFVPSKAIATTAAALIGNKRVVRFFFSYAHDDHKLAADFLKRFRDRFDTSKRYKLDLFVDHYIETGSEWKDSILTALDQCEFGLLLISTGFLASCFITENELPVFVPQAEGTGVKPVVPVGLKEVDFSHQDLKGLAARQIFLRETSGRRDGQCYAECRGDAEKDNFVLQLFLKVCAKLDSHYGPPPSGGTPPSPPRRPRDPSPQGGANQGEDSTDDAARQAPPAPPMDARLRFDAQFRHWTGEQVALFVRTLAHDTTFKDLEASDGQTSTSGEPRDVLDELEAWACATGPATPPFCAVLGEYGIGKTTTLKKLTEQLLDRRETDSSVPLPIYIDLRLRLGDPKQVPVLEDLLAEVIRRNHLLTHTSTLTPQDVLHLVREEGALIIFDGLDEKIVHLSPEEAQAYIRELWRILPPALRRAQGSDKSRRGKLLISCRSHYFRDVLSQSALLCGHDRDSIRRAPLPKRQAEGEEAEPSRGPDYKVLLMLPFSEQQIRSYLLQLFGSEERADEAFAMLEQIHNLRDLAARPVLLSYITEDIESLEQAARQGEVIHAAGLYQRLTERWLTRDNGKHQLDLAHKRLLMERLAGHLASLGLRELSADDLEAWLDQFLYDEPVIASAYLGRSRPVLKEDLRTATFMVRPESGEGSGSFRFAHTSLQEFFLASHLLRALREGRLQRWDLPMVSRETLDFFCQLLGAKPEPTVLRSWEGLLGAKPLRAAVLAFHAWLRACQLGAAQPSPAHVDLEGADLDGLHITPPASPLIPFPFTLLPLSGANLRHARLNRARLQSLDLRQADLTGAELRQAVCLDVQADGAILEGAHLEGLMGRGGSLRNLLAATASGHWEWSAAEMLGAQLPLTFSAAPMPPLQKPEADAAARAFLASVGHQDSVTVCAWSPDGQKLLSGSGDNTLKVWDAQSGRCLLDLTGHKSTVTACAWSPDGKKLLSGSGSNTLKVWDAQSGRCLLDLTGHKNSVSACAWSPDGQKLLSGSRDDTLKVWDAQSGRCLLDLTGHQHWVYACAWSPDGLKLLSGSRDNTLKVWDAQSGRCLLDLTGHKNWVSACAWSPDGLKLLSGSGDNTLKVWDAQSGRCLLDLSGHQHWVSACAWSPDGQKLLSGSRDNTLKVWDALSGRCLLDLSGHQNSVSACAWSPDGQKLLSGSRDNTLKVWDALSGRCLLDLSGHQRAVTACAWSPDGQKLLSGSYDNTLKVWDALSGRCLLDLSGHQNSVSACAWSPDGQKLLSSSEDGTLKVWDAHSGECLATLLSLPERQHVSLVGHSTDRSSRDVEFLSASPEAWRFLAWRTPELRLLPIETYGPLPVS